MPLPHGGWWPAKRVGGGIRLNGNELNHAFQIPKHLARRNPKRPHALIRKPAITPGVPRGGKIVRFAIDFHAELGTVTVEIEHIWPSRMLLSEPNTKPVLPNCAPEKPLGL